MGIVINSSKTYEMDFLVYEYESKEVYDMFERNEPKEIHDWIDEKLRPMVPYKTIRSISYRKWPYIDAFTKEKGSRLLISFHVSRAKREICH